MPCSICFFSFGYQSWYLTARVNYITTPITPFKENILWQLNPLPLIRNTVAHRRINHPPQQKWWLRIFTYIYMYVYSCLCMRGNYLELGGRRAYYKREVIRVSSLTATEANVGARSSRSRALLVAFFVMMRV